MSKHRRSPVIHQQRAATRSVAVSGATLLGTAVLAAGFLPLTGGAAFADTATTAPTAAQCKAYTAAEKAAKESAADLLDKQAAEREAKAKLTSVLADPDATEAEKTVARENAAKASNAAEDAYNNDVQAQGNLKDSLKAIGSADNCADGGTSPIDPVKPTDPVKPVRGGHGWGHGHGHGWGHGHGCGCSEDSGSTTQPSTSGALFSITPASFSSEASPSSSPSSSDSTESSAPAVSDASAPSDTVAGDTTPVGAADTGDGSYTLSGYSEPGATRDHIGEALVGLGGLGLAAGAGMAATVLHRRRQRI